MIREVLTLDALRAMSPDAAAALLVYRRSEGAGALDADVLAAWLELSPSHAEAWDNARGAWADFEGGEDDEILAALRADARAAGRERPRWTMQAAAAAAVVVLAVGGVVGVAVQQSGDGAGPPVVATAPRGPGQAGVAYANTQGGPQTWRLADGTRMTLDAGSAANVSLAAARRDVRLARGRAFFEVAHDAQRPFAVRAAGQEIVALGTRFDVRLRPGETRVVLLEGRVSVGAVGARAPVTLLRPGEQLVVREGAPPVVSPADIDEAADWQARYVVFENVTLAEAAEQLNRLGPDQLVVRDPKVAALRITGRFRAGDLPRFGRSLSLLHPVRIVRRGPSEWEIVGSR